MFERFRSKDTENFAIELVREFSRRYPPGAPDASAQGSNRTAVFARAVDDLWSRVADFQRAKRLGVYGKAKFGTAFKYQLKDLGYEDELVDELVRTLLIRMSGK